MKILKICTGSIGKFRRDIIRIESKEDYRLYLRSDQISLGLKNIKPKMILRNEKQAIWSFQRLLRKVEYYSNCKKGVFNKIYLKFLYYRLFRKQISYGFHIAPNSFGPGLSIAHIGTIVINAKAKIGTNCRLHVGTNIGMNGRKNEVATIGNNVYMATGSIVTGNITIADGVIIGANAVVTKSVNEEYITVAGIPAKKISDNGNSFPKERKGYDVAIQEVSK